MQVEKVLPELHAIDVVCRLDGPSGLGMCMYCNECNECEGLARLLQIKYGVGTHMQACKAAYVLRADNAPAAVVIDDKVGTLENTGTDRVQGGG